MDSSSSPGAWLRTGTRYHCLKRPKHEADHLYPPSASSYTSTPSVRLPGVMLN